MKQHDVPNKSACACRV